MVGPLAGIKVLDLSRILSGPFCTALLADLGADVVKVEKPPKGDLARNLGPQIKGDSAYFMSVNRGKRSVTADIFTRDGAELIKALAIKADILVENYTPGTMQDLGLGFDQLEALNKRLIYASITGFGQSGPYSNKPALDAVVQAMGGLMSVTGEKEGPPLRPGVSLGDSLAGIFTALSITSALHQRNVTGLGQHIDISMLDCQVTLMENAFSRYFATHEVPQRLGSRHPSAAPFQSFATQNGHIVIALLNDDPAQWEKICNAVELSHLAVDERFINNSKRVENRAQLEYEFDTNLSKKTTEYWIERLDKANAPAAPVLDIDQVSKDPQIRFRNMISTIPHKNLGTWQVANSPFNFSNAETGPAGPSPELGEHTEEVLSEWLDN